VLPASFNPKASSQGPSIPDPEITITHFLTIPNHPTAFFSQNVTSWKIGAFLPQQQKAVKAAIFRLYDWQKFSFRLCHMVKMQ
jgi:hypothetical protein